MDLSNYIQTIQIHLIETHATILKWFVVEERLKQYQPSDGGWTIGEILEHIALTSHFLLILIEKGAGKALRNTKALSLEEELKNYDFSLEKLDAIGQHKSFSWIRPEHMEPTGQKGEVEIKSQLIEQLNRCLSHLEQLKGGEGLLNTTRMTVNDLGRLNVYEYIYFLSKHAARHIQQMEENQREFEQK